MRLELFVASPHPAPVFHPDATRIPPASDGVGGENSAAVGTGDDCGGSARGTAVDGDSTDVSRDVSARDDSALPRERNEDLVEYSRVGSFRR